MRKISFSTALILSVTLFFISCKKTETADIITTGNWHVSYYHESNDDHTGDFSGYIFTFNDDGRITATKPGVTNTGSWSVDDHSNRFNISFSNSGKLDELSEDWRIGSKTSTEIVLIDDNSSKNEEVHFTKN